MVIIIMLVAKVGAFEAFTSNNHDGTIFSHCLLLGFSLQSTYQPRVSVQNYAGQTNNERICAAV